MKSGIIILLIAGGIFNHAARAQIDSATTYKIGLILPFEADVTLHKLNAYDSAADFYTASRISLSEDAQISLDFYEGAVQALNESQNSFKVELRAYDNNNDDSVTQELLKKDELRNIDILIGSVSSSSAKLVADYCRRNKIINIQPFSPSRSLAGNNPFHLKLATGIDAHTDAMFGSIVDSFAGSNVIIYTPEIEKSKSVALRFDSLFRDYNKSADKKFSVVLLNTNDMLLNGVKTTAKEQLKKGKTNVLIITSFEESFINGNLRVLHDELKEHKIIVYGMPTWLKGELLRLDYLNDFHTHLSDPFFIDSTKTETQRFIQNYSINCGVAPSHYSYLGYDAMNFTLQALKNYGKDFMDFISTQRYSGTAYTFDIARTSKNNLSVNYLENRNAHVFEVENYLLRKVW